MVNVQSIMIPEWFLFSSSTSQNVFIFGGATGGAGKRELLNNFFHCCLTLAHAEIKKQKILTISKEEKEKEKVEKELLRV